MTQEWKSNIVQGKTCDTRELTVLQLYKQVQEKLRHQNVEHIGTIRIEGLNSQGELEDVMKIIARHLRIDQEQWNQKVLSIYCGR